MTPVIDYDTLSVSDLVVALQAVSNREVDEFNLVYDRMDAAEDLVRVQQSEMFRIQTKMEKLEAEKRHLAAKVSDVLGKTEFVQENAEKHMQMLRQANRERDQAQDKLDQALITIASYKQQGSPKQIREKFKSYQEKAATNQKALTAAKGDNKAYRKDKLDLNNQIQVLRNTIAQTAIQTLWSENGQHLILFPSPLTMAVNGKAEKQITLLFMDQTGCGKLIGIDEDGIPLLCQMPKGGLKPKAATLAKAGNILRKFKKKNWQLSHNDLLGIVD